MDPWVAYTWDNPPAHTEQREGRLLVVTRDGSDYWRTTHYGYVRDSGHFFGRRVDGDASVEVSFEPELAALYDQAGLMIKAAPTEWIKAGIELVDGQLQASVVVTHGTSDWSTTPVASVPPHAPITFRVSRARDSVIVRYRAGEDDWILLRVAFMSPSAEVEMGLMCCSPSREGLRVWFDPIRIGPPDDDLEAD
jgi:uncharacterized protein